MTLRLRSVKKHTRVYRSVKKLYREAFPKEERAPFHMIASLAAKGKADFWAAYDGDEFVGFIYVVCRRRLAYLFYFAVKADKRSMGYGSGILAAVKKRYTGKCIFLALEECDKSAPNYEQRLGRAEFYRKNGFEYMPCKIKEASVVYDTMSIGGSVTAEEYTNLMTAWGGRAMLKLTDMRVIDKCDTGEREPRF